MQTLEAYRHYPTSLQELIALHREQRPMASALLLREAKLLVEKAALRAGLTDVGNGDTVSDAASDVADMASDVADMASDVADMASDVADADVADADAADADVAASDDDELRT